jgi:hypothetical protein
MVHDLFALERALEDSPTPRTIRWDTFVVVPDVQT